MSGGFISDGFSLTRFLAIFIKEFIQMRRDRITFAMMLGVPMMQLVLFGFAINSDPKHLPAALLDLAHDRYSRAVSQAFEHSGYYRFEHLPASAAEAEALLTKGAVSFIVTIPGDFGTRAARGDSPKLLVEADASDPAAASNAVGVLGTIAGRALTRELGREQAAAEESRQRVEIVAHRRYNPEGISQYNIVPGLLGVILQMTMVMMTAMALVRETERGTMENLLAMPAAPAEIMLGKITPYLGVGMVQVIVVLIAAKKMFAVPFVGDLSLLLLGIFIFVISLVLLGYAISTFARAQMQAMQLSVFVFLPSLLLSGFMFPFAGMPGWAQVLGEAFPLTHFLRVVRAVMLKGADFSAVAGEMSVLLLFVGLYAALALARFRRTLD
jgi:ABC-2 type transport system permease protein